MSIVEAMVAAMLLLVGILAVFTSLDGARRLNTVNERTGIATHLAERQVERAGALAFDRLELAATPSSSSDPLDPRFYVSGSEYDWDAVSSTNALEALVVRPSSSTNADALAERSAWTQGPWSGWIDTFVTQVATDLKRVTVAVTFDDGRAPRRPIVVSSLVSRHAQAQS